MCRHCHLPPALLSLSGLVPCLSLFRSPLPGRGEQSSAQKATKDWKNLTSTTQPPRGQRVCSLWCSSPTPHTPSSMHTASSWVVWLQPTHTLSHHERVATATSAQGDFLGRIWQGGDSWLLGIKGAPCFPSVKNFGPQHFLPRTPFLF